PTLWRAAPRRDDGPRAARRDRSARLRAARLGERGARAVWKRRRARQRPIRRLGPRPQLVQLGRPELLSPGMERQPGQRLPARLRGLSRLASLLELWFGARAGGVQQPRFSLSGHADRKLRAT